MRALSLNIFEQSEHICMSLFEMPPGPFPMFRTPHEPTIQRFTIILPNGGLDPILLLDTIEGRTWTLRWDDTNGSHGLCWISVLYDDCKPDEEEPYDEAEQHEEPLS